MLQLAAAVARATVAASLHGRARVSMVPDPTRRLESSEESDLFAFRRNRYAKFSHLRMGGGNGQKSAKVILHLRSSQLTRSSRAFFSFQAREKAQAKMESAGGKSL